MKIDEEDILLQSEPASIMQSIAQTIAREQKNGKWSIGMEPFYSISQTTFALRVLLWERNLNVDASLDWLEKQLSNESLPSYTRTLAWPVYLFRDLNKSKKWNNLFHLLIDKLLKLQNRDGSWGHGNLSKRIKGSGQSHPFPTALAILALANSPKITSAVTNKIQNGVQWILRWVETATDENISSWALSLIALHEADTHDVDAKFFQTQIDRIASIVHTKDSLILEEMPNAARHLDAPYILLSPAWVLIALSKLSGLETFIAQIKIVRFLSTLVQHDGRVGLVKDDPNPHIYCAFNVFYALRAFYQAHCRDRLITNLIREEGGIIKMTRIIQKKRPRVFIGSSVEGLKLAREIQQNFEHDDLDCVVWEQDVFKPSKTAIESLEKASQDFDFAILVLTPDDIEIRRNTIRPAIRDNIIFEFGLFMGALSRLRVFGIHPRGLSNFPSDLLGMNLVDYDSTRLKSNIQAAVAPACNRIRKEMVKLGQK